MFQRLQSKNAVSIGKLRIRYSDLLFLCVFLFFAFFFAVRTPYGITVDDESLFQLYNYRLVDGEHLFVDDWMISNLNAVFTFLPYRVFTWLLGGTEGILLTLRYLYHAIKLLFFLFIYFSMREYGAWSVLAGALYVGTDLFGLKTTSYYSVCVNAVFLAGTILFLKKQNKPISYLAAGFLFSCAVVAEPPIALVWAVFTLLVFANYVLKKRGRDPLGSYGFILDPKIWRWLFYGICAAVAVFLFLCAICFTGTDLNKIVSGLAEMMKYITFETGTGVSTTMLRLIKIVKYAFLYNPMFFLAFFVIYFLAVPLHRYTKKREKLWFSLLSVLFILMSVRLILLPFESDGPLPFNLITFAFFPLDDASGECVCHPLLLSFLALAAYTFTKEKNRKLYAFMLLSFAVSAAVDISSNNSFGSMLLIGSVPAVLLLRDYFKEQHALRLTEAEEKNTAAEKAPPKKKPQTKKTAGRRAHASFCILIILLCFVPSFELWHWIYMGSFHETERGFCASAAPLDTRINEGVLKGIVTTKELADNYKKSVADADAIKKTGRKRLWVIDYDTTVYFNADASVCTPATHLTGSYWGTEEAWWEINPEKRPDVAYVPFFSLSYLEFGDITPEDKLTYLREHAQIDVTEGKTGYIVKIERWY